MEDVGAWLRGFESLEEACYDLGNRFYYGKGQQQDYSAAAAMYRKAADRGHAPSQASLGNAYIKGKRVEQNLLMGVEWTRLAAEQGNAAAQCNSGVSYEHGEGVPQSLDQTDHRVPPGCCQRVRHRSTPAGRARREA